MLVDFDTLRADGLSAYGNPRPTSPHLDAFARSATRFAWAFAQAPYTLPSQVSILTSLYPQTHGVIQPKQRMGPEAFTLAEAFRAAGWRTGAFVDGGYVTASIGFDQGFETFLDFHDGGLAKSEGAISGWLRAHAGERFFLFVHTYDTHAPYAPPEPYRSRFAAALRPSPGFEPTVAALELIRASRSQDTPLRLPANDLGYARALYDGEVAFVDAWFGRLMQQLEELGLAQRTVIAVVSDHGEEFQEHGSLLHEDLYTTVTRVPLLLRTPGGPAGQVIEGPVETIDLMPTLLELAGLPLPPGLQGRSLASTVGDGAPLPSPRAGLALSPFQGGQRAIVNGDRHLILTLDNTRVEMFDYRRDPLELTDLAPGRSEEVRQLLRALRARTRGLPGRPVVRVLPSLPEDVVSSLRALGYLH